MLFPNTYLPENLSILSLTVITLIVIVPAKFSLENAARLFLTVLMVPLYEFLSIFGTLCRWSEIVHNCAINETQTILEDAIEIVVNKQLVPISRNSLSKIYNEIKPINEYSLKFHFCCFSKLPAQALKHYNNSYCGSYSYLEVVMVMWIDAKWWTMTRSLPFCSNTCFKSHYALCLSL